MNAEELREAVLAVSVPVYMTERAEIIDWYRDHAGQNWKSKLVADLMPIAQLKRTTLMRRFQAGRENSPKMTQKTRAEYEALGQTLEAKGHQPPPGGYRVEFCIWMVISGECPGDAEERCQTIIIPPVRQALDFCLNPTFDTILFYYFKEYHVAAYCPDAGESWAIVEAIDEGPGSALTEDESEDEDEGE